MNKKTIFTAITAYILFSFQITAPCSPKICQKTLASTAITCPSTAGCGYLILWGCANPVACSPAIQPLVIVSGALGASICCMATCFAPLAFIGIEEERERNIFNLRHAIQPHQLNMLLTPVQIQPAQQPEYILAATTGNSFIDPTSRIHIK